jgi:hypothetical protein
MRRYSSIKSRIPGPKIHQPSLSSFSYFSFYLLLDGPWFRNLSGLRVPRVFKAVQFLSTPLAHGEAARDSYAFTVGVS